MINVRQIAWIILGAWFAITLGVALSGCAVVKAEKTAREETRYENENRINADLSALTAPTP